MQTPGGYGPPPTLGYGSTSPKRNINYYDAAVIAKYKYLQVAVTCNMSQEIKMSRIVLLSKACSVGMVYSVPPESITIFT